MNQIVKYVCDELNGAEISCVTVSGEPWFKSVDVREALGFETKQSRNQALTSHVDCDDKQSFKNVVSQLQVNENIDLDGSVGNAILINESGLCALIFGSKKEEAKIFKHWVTGEVLPTIRKTGVYSSPLVGRQIKLSSENDLHDKVMDCIRHQFPELHVVPGLGEMQITPQQRSDGWKKGYVGGQPDLLILNRTTIHNGFAIELKTPKGDGVLSTNQSKYLENLTDLKYKTLVSNNYDVIVIELTKYYNKIRFPCRWCAKAFKSKLH